MSGAHLAALRLVDDLYERVVVAPEAWTDAALEEWGGEVFADGPPPSRETAREVRRCLRIAKRLRDFWLNPPDGVPSDAGDWRTRVDMAFGIRAWRPVLGIAQAGLREAPSSELYEEVKARFREVHGVPWMDGVSYADWAAEEADS
jgi:hypothetical protein